MKQNQPSRSSTAQWTTPAGSWGWRSPHGARPLPGLVSTTSFLRSVDLPFVTVASELRRRFEQTERGGVATLGPTLSMAPIRIDVGQARVGLVIRRRFGPLRRALRMDLELSPLPGGRPATRMELVARQRVRSGRHYFRTGHSALDSLVAQLSCATLRKTSGSDAPCVGHEEPRRLAG
jgi:hypothetical protein